MSGIGSFTFIKMEGPQLPALASAVQIIERPGVDGSAARTIAQKAELITKFTTEAVTHLATANAAADDYANLKGNQVTVVDDLGRSVNNVLVADVRVLAIRSLANCNVSTYNYLIEAVWTLKPTQ